MSARVGFFATTLIGGFYAIYGLFSSLTDFGIGAAIACIGVIGYEFCGWRQ